METTLVIVWKKMWLLSIFLCTALSLQFGQQSQGFIGETYRNDPISCYNDKTCIFIEHCPAISNLMNRNLLPIHRFRQAICGYESTKPKVCCDVDNNSVNPFFTEEGGIYVSNSNLIPECGRSLIQSNFDTVGTYPFVARVGFTSLTGEIKYSCSGVILNERTVLTTASCALAKSDKFKLHSILVGEFNSETNPDCNSLFCGHECRRYNISYVIKHPNYQSNSFTNNIALLRLDGAVQFTVTTQPICILPRQRQINVGSISTLVGWGKLSTQRVKSSKQQSLEMKIISNQECSRYYAQGYSIELCAMGNVIPCSGYSGSPLLLAYDEKYYLLGLLSYGPSCDSGLNLPSVFTNVQRYERWILENC